MPNCFVIMPFKPELHYMYLYVKYHIERKFPDVKCERGDAKILTVPLLDKIVNYIQESDVIVADCTGRNPNVFYELGIAHAFNKKVILITADPAEEAPTDIRAFEFIRYKLDDHLGFCEKLDRALEAALGDRFGELYNKALELLDRFSKATNFHPPKASPDEFASSVRAREGAGRPPPHDDEKALAKFLLPIIIAGPADLDLMLRINEWIDAAF